MYNPFSLDIYKLVLEKIFATIKDPLTDRDIILICYGRSDYETIKNSGLFSLVDVFVENEKDSTVFIWEHKKSNNLR